MPILGYYHWLINPKPSNGKIRAPQILSSVRKAGLYCGSPDLISSISSSPLVVPASSSVLPMSAMIPSKTLLPTSHRTKVCSRRVQRSLHQSSSSRDSPLFQLGALSNSRETRWLSKTSGISPVEYSPQLQLIKSGEVEPFRSQDKPRTGHCLRSAKSSTESTKSRTRTIGCVGDTEALNVGRAILQQHKKERQRLERALAIVKRTHERERAYWESERRKLLTDMRNASFVVVASAVVATAMAAWRFAPGSNLVEDLVSPINNGAPPETSSTVRETNDTQHALDGMALLHYVNYDCAQDEKSLMNRSLAAKQEAAPKPCKSSWQRWFWSSPD